MKEDSIQQQIYLWFNNTFCLKTSEPRFVIFHVANGGKRSKSEGMYFKKIGVLAGVSDLIILTDKVTIFVEVKNEFGKQSDKQKDFQDRVEALGFNYILVRSLEEFQKKIKKLL